MRNTKKFLAIIPARGGSKGIRGKNKVPCANKPLIEWTIHVAKKCQEIDEICCSTDDSEIADIAKKNKISIIKRPKYLAKDSSRMLGVVLHTLKTLEKQKKFFDYVVLLQPTSPLRTAEDISLAIKTVIQSQASSLVTVHPIDLRSGLLVYGKNENGILKTTSLDKRASDLPRQKTKPLFYVNGCIYIWKRSILKKGCFLNSAKVGLVLENSHTIDIDTKEDLIACEKYLLERKSDDI